MGKEIKIINNNNKAFIFRGKSVQAGFFLCFLFVFFIAKVLPYLVQKAVDIYVLTLFCLTSYFETNGR